MIGVIGGGQLGRMLALAGYRLGHRFCFLDPSAEAPAGRVGDLIVGAYDDRGALDELAGRSELITYEFENVPARSLRAVEDRVPVFPRPAALEVAQDRLAEKQLFQRVGLPVAPFAPVDSASELSRALDVIGFPAVLKTRRDGYDGKGQHVIDDEGDAGLGWEEIGGRPLLAERVVAFDRELSIIAVRARSGETAFYPLIENEHRDGILRLSWFPAPNVDPDLEAAAQSWARSVLECLDYVGVLAIEMFEAGGRLVGNEMAPRVHNSGHLTIEAAATSQFDNHIRAVTGLPLGSTRPLGCAAMVNLIGERPDLAELLAHGHTHVHLYDKEPRPGRKLGHVTVVGEDLAAVRKTIAELPLP